MDPSGVLATEDLVRGKTIGSIHATTLEANTALPSSAATRARPMEEFLTRLAQASGIETPTSGLIGRGWIASARRRAIARTGDIRTIRMRASRR